MKARVSRAVWLPAVVALGFIVLDLILDLWVGYRAPLNWPHLVYAILVTLIVFFAMNRAINERERSELAAQQARDVLELRVQQRTAALRQANESLSAEIAERQRVEAALRESEETARVLMYASPDSAILIDPEGVILAANEPTGARLGLSPEEMIGRHMFEVFRSDVVEGRKTVLDQVLRSGRPTRYVEASSAGMLDISVSPVLDVQGRVIRLAAFGHDITHLREAEEALAASEERYRTLFDGFPEPLTVWSREGKLVMQNLVSAGNMGGTPADFLGTTIHAMFGEAGAGYLDRIVHVIDTGVAETREDALELDGELRYFWTVMQRIEGWEAQGGAAQVISYEITERVRLEEVARRAQVELAQRALERTALEERQRLARELHDSVSQALYGISLGANTALKLFDTDRDKVLEALGYVLNLARGGLAEMRALIFDLRPESLETDGLVTAITHQAAAVGARQSIHVELSLCGEPDASLAAKDALYRIAQEALHNAAKHARCNRLEVQLTCDEEWLELQVVDDGVGFDPSASYPGHLGLRSMRERAQGACGTLEIASALGEGTRVRVRVARLAEPPACGC